MALASQASKSLVEHGQHIFIYCNIRTKQVLYSLDRVMNVSSETPKLSGAVE